MKAKIFSFFRGYWQKLVLIGLLAVACAVFERLSFNTLEYLIRDNLQYLNSTKNIDKSLVTLRINTFSKHGVRHPHTADSFKKIIAKIQESGPRFILVMMEPIDLDSSEKNKREIFDYFVSQKNIYLNAYESSHDLLTFAKDPIFKNYTNFFGVEMCLDSKVDRKNRRAIVNYNKKGPPDIISDIRKLGLVPKDPSYFQYSWDFWETKQAYIKNYPLGAYGYLQTDDLLDGRIPSSAFEDKIVILGTHDEYTFLSPRSVFNTFVQFGEKNMNDYVYPFQDTVANIINFHTTGDYIKLVSSVSDMYFVFALLILLILVPFSNLKKLYFFLSLVPLILGFVVVLYTTSSFYIDVSKSVAFLFFAQYFAVPIVMLSLFKSQEQQRLKEINDARIDSFLSVSESVAHDIRSPLSAINLILSRVNIENPEYREIIKSSLVRIDETAEKILTKYKGPNANRSEIFESINIIELINSSIAEKKLFNPKIEYKIISLNSDTSFVLGHRLELERIISNILDNSIHALKSNSSNPEIFFELFSSHESVTLEIADNGSGISAGLLTLLGKDRVTTKALEKGNGLALLHAKRSIERMNGSFKLSSVESERTTVSITLKVAGFSDTK